MKVPIIHSGYSSTATISISVYTKDIATPVKNFAAALYDSSGIRIDSLVAQDTNVVKFSNVNITSIHSSRELPTGYSLEQNYPNPFNPSTRIQFTVPHAGPVSLKTYTILGQEDASLELTLEPGSYEAQYSPGGAAGVVFYRLITKDFTETKKMIQFGGEKPGKSKLTLVSSGMQSRSQRSGTISEYQAKQIMVKLRNLPFTDPPIEYTTILIIGLTGDTTMTVYVNQAKGVPCPGIPTVIYAGQTYHTVQVGGQCWLKENLNVGTMVDSLLTQTNNGVIEKYCFRNDTANCNTYGAFYQWNEAMQYNTTEGTQGICPTGWRIPTYAELETLTTAVKKNGNTLKAVGEGPVATDSSGFSGLLTGYRDMYGFLLNLGDYAFLWSSTQYDANTAFNMTLYYDDGAIYVLPVYKTFGYSVRCIKN
ncbi:MAG: FISUMP domain-containing protein [Bacteroidota bacterium]